MYSFIALGMINTSFEVFSIVHIINAIFSENHK